MFLSEILLLNYFKFRGSDSRHSLTLNFTLPPPPLVTFLRCQMVYFCSKMNQFYSFLSGGGPPDPLRTFQSIHTLCWKKPRATTIIYFYPKYTPPLEKVSKSSLDIKGNKRRHQQPRKVNKACMIILVDLRG